MEDKAKEALLDMQIELQRLALQHERELRVTQAILMALTRQNGLDRQQLLTDADTALSGLYDRLESTHQSRSQQSAAMDLLYQWLGQAPD